MPSTPLVCSSCGGKLVQEEASGRLVCPYCGSLHAVENTQKQQEAPTISVGSWIARFHSPWEQSQATTALGLVIDDPALPALTQAVRRKNTELPSTASYWAAKLLALTGNRSAAVPALIEAARGEGHQSAALEALGSLGGDSAIAFLNEASKSQDPSTAEGGTKALIDAYKRGCPIPVLIGGLKHPNPDVREAVAWSLALQVPTMTDKKPVVDAFSGSLKDPSHSVLKICAGALGTLGDQTAVPALVEAFRSNYNPQDYTSHFQSVEMALKKLAPERADQLLRQLNPGLVEKQEKALRRNPDITMKKFCRGFALGGAVLGLIIGFNFGTVGAAIGLSILGAVVGYYLGAIVGAAVTSW